MEDFKGTKLDTINAELQYVQNVLFGNSIGVNRESLEVRSSYSILLYQACSVPLTDVLECLLPYLHELTSPGYFRSSLLYDCLATAHEMKHDDVVRILLDFVVTIVMDMDSMTDLTLLHCAAANGDVEVAQLLIDFGIFVDQRNDNGETALHVACDAATAEVLIINGADANALTEHNETPLYMACANCRMGVIRKLLENGANPNVGSLIWSQNADFDWGDDSSIASILLQFEDNGDNGVHVLPAPSCVWIAINEEVLPFYPLCSSCKNENQPLLAEILARKADDSVQSTVDNSSLRSAVLEFHKKKMKTGEVDVMEITDLLSKTDSGIVDAFSHQAAFYLAVEINLIEVATLLLDFGADPNLATSGKYPLVEACRYLSHEFIELLLNRGADPNVVDCNDTCPLYIAASSFNYRLVKLLVEHGVDVNYQDRTGKTALHPIVNPDNNRWCPRHGTPCIDIAKYLLNNGFSVNQVTAECDTLLYLVTKNILLPYKKPNKSRSSVYYQLFELLLERGADVNLVHSHGENAMCEATKCPFAIRELLRHGGNPNWTDQYDRSLINRACKDSSSACARILLAAGADPGLVTWDSLVCASENFNIDLIDLLLGNGVKFNVANDRLFCYSRPPEVITLREFYIPFCKDTECIVQLFKAGSSTKILATCCRDYRRRLQSNTIRCSSAGRLCQAVVLTGYKVQQQQQFVELLKRSERPHARELGSWFEEDWMTPPTLLRQSRTVVRRQLSTASGCRTILPLIDVLPITRVMRMYLKFEGPFSEIDLSSNRRCDSCSLQDVVEVLDEGFDDFIV